ncbi:MAG: NADH-quinone oxidoreductase subunit L [Phycisphaerales bacterium]|nr:MAG: NADH-quinone oxidoreductase subunit L [Phycisphaerales bacterium]
MTIETTHMMMLANTAAGPGWAGFILWFPLISLALCGLWSILRIKSKLPAWTTVGCLALAFLTTVALYVSYSEPVVIHLFDWFNLHWGSGAKAGSFVANFSLYVDSLTLLWMLFVTGLGTLIALYASEYMEPDVGKGYTRFFAGVSVFLFAMSCLVMGDNLVLLYLGWEGVGFASYWLIGYYYTKPSAVAAAKKAFIMNRIGDLGLALAIWFIWLNFGTVEFADLFAVIASGAYHTEAGGWSISAIPFLLMLGAFGKSAQIPLYVWLPDAMEGPTPVSALIHAATMVTAGVYLLCRMFPVMQLHELALPTVAWIGTSTAILSATIALAQYDIKRIMAYSTVSQLGFMFAGVGVMTTAGAAYHVFTHAFFKAVLFLTCGAIMHGFAGQLDLRKLSGIMRLRGWKVVSVTMLIGCLCLAGFPLTSGYFSKDMILAQAFTSGHSAVGWLLLFTAGLTAYYTFRVWFRVCIGPVHFEPGDEDHGDDHGHDDHGHGDHGHGDGKFHPHAPKWAVNFVLIAITVGAILAAIPYFMPSGEEGVKGGWVASMTLDSSARDGMYGVYAIEEKGKLFGADPYNAMYFVSAAFGLVGILIAWWLHLANRKAADALRAKLLANPLTRWLPTAMENKWYVDEIYHVFVRAPLWVIGHAFALIDRLFVDGLLVNGTGYLPRAVGRMFQPLQNGVLQSYAVLMAGGFALVVVLIVLVMPWLQPILADWMAGTGGAG